MAASVEHEIEVETPDHPPEQAFWDRYNARAEFPLSGVLSVLIHVAAGVLILYVLFGLMDSGPDRSTPPVRIIDVNSGNDLDGTGSMGSGGSDMPFAEVNRQALQDTLNTLPDPSVLPEIKDNLKKEIQVIDPTSNLAISDANAAALASTNQTLRKKLMGLGSQSGSGPEAGKGNTGQVGQGNGGTGASSTVARSLRWTLRFRTSSGRNYIEQVAALGAIIAVPMPPNEEKLLVIDDLRNPRNRHVADDAETARLAGMIKFSDVRRESVSQVGEALQLDFPARSFWAFFPKKLEEELTSKEKSFRNRREEDIEETVFQVTIRGGTYELVVVEQHARGR